MNKVASFLVKKHGLFDKSFYIADLSILRDKIKQWRHELPSIKPFYAVKCNPDQGMLKEMIHHNLGFDCASQHEMDTVLSLGTKPKDIIYAHPVKGITDLKHAYKQGISLTTFDSFSELDKIHTNAPNMDCIIRLKIDNPSARVQLNKKYGVDQDEYKDLINYAKDLNVNIKGVAFHVGSASREATVFNQALQFSREVFEYAKQKGYLPSVLDIGGGFTSENFGECASVIRDGMTRHFKDVKSLHAIAEPGRFFAADTMTFCVPIVGQRKRNDKNEYWIGDGLYGSFATIIYDQQKPTFEVLRNPLLEDSSHSHNPSETPQKSIVWGGVCCSFDCIGEVELPTLRNGDFLMVPNFGAYTLAGATNFNGIPMSNPKIFYLNEMVLNHYP